MLLTEVHQPAFVSLQLLPGKEILKDLARPNSQYLFFDKTKIECAVKIQTALALVEIFTIRFKLLNKLHSTKVMKVQYRTNAIYKVVIYSSLRLGSSICLFEHLSEGWVTLLGNNINAGVKKAITAAIEHQERVI
jgi:hypothetical protein